MKRSRLFLTLILACPAGAQGLPDGPDRGLYETVCGACHGADIVIGSEGSRARWQDTVDAMRNRGAVGTEEEFTKVVDYLTANFGPKPAAPAPPKPVAPKPETPPTATAPAPPQKRSAWHIFLPWTWF